MKKAQFNFVWIFALLVGGAILVLAIYGATKIEDTSRFTTDTETAKSIAIITDPLQAGFAEGSFGKISFQYETRINNDCNDINFGKNDISVASRLSFGEPWKEAGVATPIYNKYIFSPEKSSGKIYYTFSKPFEFPYKIADLIFLIPDNYCFLDAPDEIVDEITKMKMPMIEANGTCTLPNATKVCFASGSDCDIKVTGASQMAGTVKNIKTGTTTEYVDNLMYAAIFSDKSVCDCNIKRLKYRATKIAESYAEKADLMNARGCGTNMKPDLISWGVALESEDFISLKMESQLIQRKNDGEVCKLW